MRKILFILFILFPICSFAFEIKDLADYQSVAVKVFVESDSLHKKNKENASTEIQGTKELVRVLGKNKVYYKTEFVYMADKKTELIGETTWYFYTPKSLNGNKKYKLYYRKNDATWAGKPNDTLVIAKKSKDEILFLIVKKDSAAEKELYEHLKLRRPDAPKPKSWWGRLWHSSDTPPPKPTLDDELPELPARQVSQKQFIGFYFTPGPDCENGIIENFNNSKKTADVAVYAITNKRIHSALVAAHKRGVKIRVITDRTQAGHKSSLSDEISKLGIPVRTNVGHKLMHHKFAVFDGKALITGSYNWTENATKSNAENCLFMNHSAKDLSKEFDGLWKKYQR